MDRGSSINKGRMLTVLVGDAYVEDIMFSLGFTEHVLGAKNCCRYFACITLVFTQVFWRQDRKPGCLVPLSGSSASYSVWFLKFEILITS